MIIGLGESALLELPVFSDDNRPTDDGDINNFSDSSFDGDENKGNQQSFRFLSDREYLPVGDKVNRYPSSSYDAQSLQYEGPAPYLPPSTTTSTTTTIYTHRLITLPPESSPSPKPVPLPELRKFAVNVQVGQSNRIKNNPHDYEVEK